ncbi:hypothetical protein [Flavobacterium sp. KACC 22761]|uniref:hypothetical protein n=1 Tax=Flavobacterium sp. KACC 22761 TaxID=3092665 RepID=UPI002A759921|nr:hypothetical protein [Flavobacterium sp. KACC 22761]WPO77486.1 hypothetical protein SCB73_14550 [Flavobacterium sp. KACC 22761]
MINIEIPFNKDIYTEQSKLHFDAAWAKNLKTNRTNKIISIVTTLLGILIIVGKNNVGGIFCMIGWFGFYLVYRTNTSYKQNKKKYFEAISNEIKSRETASDHPIWELHDDYFHYKDYQHDLNFKWPAIVKYTKIDETIFVDSKLGIRFMLSEKEVGKEKFEEIIVFFDRKIIPIS